MNPDKEPREQDIMNPSIKRSDLSETPKAPRRSIEVPDSRPNWMPRRCTSQRRRGLTCTIDSDKIKIDRYSYSFTDKAVLILTFKEAKRLASALLELCRNEESKER